MSSPAETRSPAQHIPTLAAALDREGFPKGDRAKLRRMGAAGPAPLAFHRFVIRHVDARWQGEHWIPAWRTLICALAIPARSAYDPRTPLGLALAKVRFSEGRFERLVASDGATFHTLLLRAARQLSAKGQRADWRIAAALLFAPNETARDAVNLRFARDYYRKRVEE